MPGNGNGAWFSADCMRPSPHCISHTGLIFTSPMSESDQLTRPGPLWLWGKLTCLRIRCGNSKYIQISNLPILRHKTRLAFRNTQNSLGASPRRSIFPPLVYRLITYVYRCQSYSSVVDSSSVTRSSSVRLLLYLLCLSGGSGSRCLCLFCHRGRSCCCCRGLCNLRLLLLFRIQSKFFPKVR